MNDTETTLPKSFAHKEICVGDYVSAFSLLKFGRKVVIYNMVEVKSIRIVKGLQYVTLETDDGIEEFGSWDIILPDNWDVEISNKFRIGKKYFK